MVLQYTNAFVTIASVNWENLVNFYTKLLEQKPVLLTPNVYAEFNLVGMRLGIFQPKNTNESEFEAMSNDNPSGFESDTLGLANAALTTGTAKTTTPAPLYFYTKSKISLCLEVGNLEDAIAHLRYLGYPPPGEISIASHGKEIYAYDPDGNRLILHQAQESAELEAETR
ncbi:VOC family protein [Nostoc sp.]|uniref:VOC family protein n=1 Tax=Nostoc sp. TaxID=1180 RepID=UPI002FEFA919